MGAPETYGVEQFEKLFQSAAFGLALENARNDANNTLVNGSEANIGLIDEQQAALRLHDELGGRTARLAILGAVQQAQQAIDLDLIGRAGRRATGGDARLGAIHGFGDAGKVKGLEQVVDGVDVKGADGVLVEGRGKDELRQGCGVFLRARLCGLGAIAIDESLNDSEPVLAGHLHIEKDKIGMVLVDEVDGLNAVGALGNHVHVAHRIEQVFELVAGQLFIVDNERGNGHGN